MVLLGIPALTPALRDEFDLSRGGAGLLVTAAFLAVRALADLDNPSLNNRQRLDRITQVAAGIRRVIAVRSIASLL